VGLARALIDRPEILLYDEPTTGLDPVATKNVDEMIRRTADEFGVTSVVISHDMASTFRIGDRISMLAGGKIIVTGTPPEVLASQLAPLREFVEMSGLVAAGAPS
jgi:phospholipid/cholesterol/gamma-HCH transport system ATP-binding protein